MSEFVNLYDVVFGLRTTHDVVVETDDGKFEGRYGSKYRVKSVDIAMVVCAIEDENCKSYCFDEFGRFGIAKDETKENTIVLLASYCHVLLFDNPNDIPEYEEYLSDADKTPDWLAFGWLSDEFPDFEACYEKWKVKNGMQGKPTPSMELPPPQSHLWTLTGKLLKTVIGEEAYKSAALGDYSKAVSALQNHKGNEFRYNESEKKALRRNLKKIVISAPISEM